MPSPSAASSARVACAYAAAARGGSLLNTPAHIVFGAAAFGKPGAPGVTWAALAGGFAPDASLYLLTFASMALGYSGQQIFGQFYYSDAWQQVFAIDNSFVLWGIALAFALRARAPAAIALTGAALIHLAFDFPLHTHDARMHFWPLTEWKFHSPISYWDGGAGGRTVEAVELAMVVGLTALLLRRFRHGWARAGFAALAAAELVPFVLWRLVL